MTTEVRVPTLGESVSEATVANWFKKPGDTIAQDEMLCELETDKVSVEVPAPAAGTLGKILVQAGDTVEAGGRLATMTKGGGTAPASRDTAPKASETPPGQGAPAGDVGHAPSARKLMEEKGLSPDRVEGSGKDGRIMKEDVLAALQTISEKPAGEAKAQPARAQRTPVPAEDAGREERVRMT